VVVVVVLMAAVATAEAAAVIIVAIAAVSAVATVAAPLVAAVVAVRRGEYDHQGGEKYLETNVVVISTFTKDMRNDLVLTYAWC
jgi:hypothetical protein